jgi:glycosyltransferase involved in cell wall biosynthesis
MTILRVTVDATPLISGDTGVALYTAEHLRALGDHPEVAVQAFAIGRGSAPPGSVKWIRTPLRVVHRSWRSLNWPTAERLAGECDVVHSIDMIPPPTRKPLVMTIHDVLPLQIPDLYGPRFVRISRHHLEHARQARVVVTTCETTADRIAETGVVSRSKIVVAPLGRRRELGLTEPLIPPPYLLAVGSVTPRKAFDLLADAIAILGEDAPTVVVAGPDGWRAEEVHARIRSSVAADKFRFLGRIDDASLERLFRHASALCHPSLAEGFGIPCLEAMGLGVPVVAADIPSVRELGDGSIELVPAGDPEAFADGLRRVLTDPNRRAELIAHGLVRSEGYTWSAMTQKIVAAYHAAYA